MWSDLNSSFWVWEAGVHPSFPLLLPVAAAWVVSLPLTCSWALCWSLRLSQPAYHLRRQAPSWFAATSWAGLQSYKSSLKWWSSSSAASWAGRPALWSSGAWWAAWWCCHCPQASPDRPMSCFFPRCCTEREPWGATRGGAPPPAPSRCRVEWAPQRWHGTESSPP